MQVKEHWLKYKNGNIHKITFFAINTRNREQEEQIIPPCKDLAQFRFKPFLCISNLSFDVLTLLLFLESNHMLLLQYQETDLGGN